MSDAGCGLGGYVVAARWRFRATKLCLFPCLVMIWRTHAWQQQCRSLAAAALDTAARSIIYGDAAAAAMHATQRTRQPHWHSIAWHTHSCTASPPPEGCVCQHTHFVHRACPAPGTACGGRSSRLQQQGRARLLVTTARRCGRHGALCRLKTRLSAALQQPRRKCARQCHRTPRAAAVNGLLRGSAGASAARITPGSLRRWVPPARIAGRRPREG